jgi:hypothetical protein
LKAITSRPDTEWYPRLKDLETKLKNPRLVTAETIVQFLYAYRDIQASSAREQCRQA